MNKDMKLLQLLDIMKTKLPAEGELGTFAEELRQAVSNKQLENYDVLTITLPQILSMYGYCVDHETIEEKSLLNSYQNGSRELFLAEFVTFAAWALNSEHAPEEQIEQMVCSIRARH